MEYAEEGTDAFIPRAKEIGVERLTLPAAIRDSKSDDERNSAHEADSTSENNFETEMNRDSTKRYGQRPAVACT